MKIRHIIFASLYLALFTVLNVISAYLPFLQMPNGGSIELGVIALFLASYHLGVKLGLFVSLLSILMQYLTQGLAAPLYIIGFNQFLFDYVFAFGSYGLASFFKNYQVFKIEIYTGIIFTYIIRYLSSTFAGVVYWKMPLPGSLVYNFGYNFITMSLALVVVPIIFRRIKLIKD